MKDYFAYVDNFFQHKHINSVNIIDNNQSAVLYSILITTFRRPILLKKAIESALDQKIIDDYEVIIVDNDYQVEPSATNLIVKSFKSEKLRYYQNRENLGMFGNWNRGLTLARGKWVTILHDDDLLLPEYLYNMDIYCKRDNNSRSLLSCNIDVLDQRAKSISTKTNFIEKIKKVLVKLRFRAARRRSLEEYFYGSPHRGTIGILFRRDFAVEMGGFDPSEYPSADYFFFAKYVSLHGSLNISKYLAVSRISENESLKNEVMISTLKQCFEFRKYLIKKCFVNSKYYLVKSKLLTVSQSNHSKLYWKGSYDGVQLLSSMKISGWFVNPIMSILFKTYLLIRRLIKS